MAIKPKDAKWEEAALRKRLEFVRSLKQALAQEDSLAAQTVSAYSSLIEEIIKEVALEVHRAVKTGVDDLSDVRHRQQRLEQREAAAKAGGGSAPLVYPPQVSPQVLGVQASGSKGVIDMFGNQVQPVALDQVACPNCGRAMAAGRFAPHLEKCMGRGRQASRAAPIYKETHL